MICTVFVPQVVRTATDVRSLSVSVLNIVSDAERRSLNERKTYAANAAEPSERKAQHENTNTCKVDEEGMHK